MIRCFVARGTHPNAKVVSAVPPERVETFAKNGRLPRIGELVLTEQMWTAKDGRTMINVYCLDEAGQEVWSAEMFPSELEALPGAGDKI